MRFLVPLILIQALLVSALPPKLSGITEKYLVTDLPGLHQNIPEDDIPLMFSGQLELFPENHTNYYFWKFSDDQKRLPENNKRTIFWFNGGPGCSSMDGALLELGPFRVNSDQKVVYNSGTWHKLADVVFVDQPAGTGYSYGDKYSVELADVAFNYLKFMEKYFELFPEESDNEIYLAGESYAGQYIPYVAQAILEHNKREEKKYDLKGLLIGNGWISPNEHGLSYLPYAIQAGIINTNNPHWATVLDQHEKCQKIVNDIDAGNGEQVVSSDVCEKVLNKILQATLDLKAPSNEQCVNMYDYTLRDSFPACGATWPHELSYVTPFLGTEEVMGDLNLKYHKKWKECTGRVSHYLTAKHSVPAVQLLPDLLAQIPVVLFNGNRDIICNYLGTESMIKKMSWNGQQGFSDDVEAIDWVYDKELSGYIKTERNLTFVNVFDSSHMVPYDKSEVSRALIDLITGNYDEVDTDNKKRIVTYPIGVRWDRLQQEKETPPTETPETPPTETSDPEVPSGSSSSEPDDVSKFSNRATRLIQLVVIAVLIWGIYVIYTSFTAKPSSIIKKVPNNSSSKANGNKKKNVQWADQLRRFQEDDPEFQRQKNQGFLSKTIDKLKGTERGRYAPVNADKVYEDIEMGDQPPSPQRDVDDFIIESEDEQEQGHVQSSHAA